MYIDLAKIHESPGNARTILTSDEADRALMTSLDTIGLLQPVLVVPNGIDDEYELRAGHRRLRAARALGWETIQAIIVEPSPFGGARSDVPETAMSAAENMVRAAMHPVDQWRAIAALRDQCGYSLETASAALGVSLATARRMEHLGHLAPDLLEAIARGDLPEVRYLRIIAMASHEMQCAGLAKAKLRQRAGQVVDWREVAEACTIRRIPASRALFDPATFAWDEDLFAEPDADDRFSSTDRELFLQHQEAALTAMIAKSKGRIERLGFDENGPISPKGFRFVHADVPKRWRKEDPRRCFAALYRDGYSIGLVTFRMAEPVAQRPDAQAQDMQWQAPEKPARPAISKTVQRRLAEMKSSAVVTRLAQGAGRDLDAVDMLRALLLLFCANNVRAGDLSCSPHNVIAGALVSPQGTLREEADLCAIAAYVIGNALVFQAPDVFSHSGPAAEWIAQYIGAVMPRTDSAEILKGVTGEELIHIARANRVSTSGTVSTLRKRLTGSLPDWRATNFGAPGPEVYAQDDSPVLKQNPADRSEEADYEDVYEGPTPLHGKVAAKEEVE